MDKRCMSAFTDPAPEGIKILGRLVFPFSLSHRVHLEAADSPLLRQTVSIRPVDLLVAIKICAGEPVGKLTWKDSWYLGKMNGNEAYFAEQVDRFSKFVLVESWPKFWERKANKSESSGIPWMLSVVANLVMNGIPLERAWSMPECQAIWLNSSFAMINGAELKVLTTEDEELINQLLKT